jgi:hypothetical protein
MRTNNFNKEGRDFLLHTSNRPFVYIMWLELTGNTATVVAYILRLELSVNISSFFLGSQHFFRQYLSHNIILGSELPRQDKKIHLKALPQPFSNGAD